MKYVYISRRIVYECPVCDYLNDDSAVVCGTCGAPCDSSRSMVRWVLIIICQSELNNGMAIASMVLGIVSAAMLLLYRYHTGDTCGCIWFHCPKYNDKSREHKGKEMALTGIILGFYQ